MEKKEKIEFAVPEGFELPEDGTKIEVLATLHYNEDTGLLELNEVDGFQVSEEVEEETETETETPEETASPEEEDDSTMGFLQSVIPQQ